MDERLQTILTFLNRKHQRATYSAVSEALGLGPQAVGGMLGDRRPEASWVVNSRTLEPSGYTSAEKHAALYEKTHVIMTGLELLRRMLGFLQDDDAGQVPGVSHAARRK